MNERSIDEIIEQAIQGYASTRDAIRWAMQQEREACAQACENLIGTRAMARHCADEIRARGEWVKTYCGGKPNYTTCQENRQVAMRKTTRDEKIVNPGVYEVPEFECPRCGHCCQQKEWVGLTDEEIKDIREDLTYDDEDFNELEFARDIEAKLKEKNT